jgi:hypothetical protein
MSNYDYTVPLRNYAKQLTAEQRKVLAEILDELTSESPDPGVAGILVEKRDSRITVKHSEDGDILASGVVRLGAWDRIWDAIRGEFV